MHRRCSKHQHKSKGAAEAQLRALRARGGDIENSETLCTYLCPRCAAWHVGHNEMKIRPEPMPPIPVLKRRPGGARR